MTDYRELPIEDSIGEDITEVINEGLDSRLKKYMMRVEFAGYRFKHVPLNIVLEILRNETLKHSLYYLDIDNEYKELTEEFLNTDEYFRVVNIDNKKHTVSYIYVTTFLTLGYLVSRLPK